ncbi:MAG: toprim domain-containing protein [Bacilli bacterium]|nr:toprim domain-containing protein [Bacilli bacterium]
MIKVNESYISAEISDIIKELKTELELNGIKRFYKSIDTPKNYMVCCPFHKKGQEKRPSMGILKKDGTSHCFACQWTGSITEMISNCFGYDDFGIFGSKWLIKNFLTLEVEKRNDIQLDFSRNSRIDSNTNTYVRPEELDKYRCYPPHPYWAKRGITDERIIELFDLGYDKETDCITFPVRDIKGNCLFIARRSVRTKYFHYPSGVEKPLYGIYELYQLNNMPKELIICESMLDALTCWQYGKYAVALNGLGNELSIAQIKKLPCRKVILATDKDDAGKKARIRLRKELNNKIVTELNYKTYPDHAKDMNDMTREEFYALGEVF